MASRFTHKQMKQYVRTAAQQCSYRIVSKQVYAHALSSYLTFDEVLRLGAQHYCLALGEKCGMAIVRRNDLESIL